MNLLLPHQRSFISSFIIVVSHSVLRKHIASSSVVSRAAIALSALAKDKGNSAWLGPTGAAEALYAALQYHSNDVTVCKFVISAIGEP